MEYDMVLKGCLLDISKVYRILSVLISSESHVCFFLKSLEVFQGVIVVFCRQLFNYFN